MSKQTKIILLTIVILVVATISCVYTETNDKYENKNTELSFSDNDMIDDEETDDDTIKNYQYINLTVNQTTKINYDFLNNNTGAISFTSNDENIATVDQEGNVSAISVGTTIITMNYNGGSLEFYVTVSDSYSSNASTNQTKIHFIALRIPGKSDFKTNDAILLESNGKYGLIDTGFPSTRMGLYNYLMQFATNGTLQLDFVLITHNHIDHIGGLSYLLQCNNIKIRAVYLNKYYKNDIKDQYLTASKQNNYVIYNNELNRKYVIKNQNRYNEVIKLTKQRHKKDKDNFHIYYLTARDDVRREDGGLKNFRLGNYYIKLYNTRQQLKSSKIDYNGFDSGNCLNDYCRNADGNANSVVAKVISKVNGVSHKTLLTGDLNYSLLQGITKSAGKVDVFKMPHHGVYTINYHKGLTPSVIRNSLKNSIGSNTIVVVTAAKSKFNNRSVLGMEYVSKTLKRPLYYTGGRNGTDARTIVIDYSKQNLSVEYN